MKIHVLNTGYFKLDGGAMFGVVPKAIWQKSNPPDENNMCSWAMRSLLIEDGNRLMLIDTGIGDKQNEKFFSHFYRYGNDSLHGNLAKLGFHASDVTDVFLTHLHFDHCGGSIEWNDSKSGYRPTFPSATFLSENILPIQASGQLKFIVRTDDFMEKVFPNMDVLFVDGHTESMMIPHIKYKDKTLVFMADLLPSVGHIPLPYVMGYDTRPLITLKEKSSFLENSARENHVLFLEHDSVNECCTLQETENGVRLKETFDLSTFLS
jgi:glyoxylase-like metal-dependent hydrolase (beta-lactamase superfamily II)